MNHKRFLAAALALLLLAAPITPAHAQAGAPIAENLKLSTYRGVSTDGQLKATDPEGDPITFQITTPPIKGTVDLKEDGSFVYTPEPNRRGKDYFGYTATDVHGNISQEATVIIDLLKQKTKVTYADLNRSSIHYDAIRLAEAGVFTGQQLGGDYIFSPDTMIGRGEFLSMCMTISDLSILTAVTNTGYPDDSGIPNWQKPYIATARMHGRLTAINDPDTENFDATEPITCAEAAAMIDGIFRLSKVSAISTDITPQWAAQSVANLISCDILPANCDTAQYVNRALAADILSSLMDVLEQR